MHQLMRCDVIALWYIRIISDLPSETLILGSKIHKKDIKVIKLASYTV